MLKKAFLLLLASTCLTAQETEEPTCSYWDIHPLHVGGNAIRMGSANVSETPLRGNLIFGKYNAFTDLLVPVTKNTYFFPRVGWTAFTLDWNKNPKFNETQFNYAEFSLTFFSTELEDWRWIARAQYNLDTKHFDNARQYGLFSGLVWGSNKLFEKWNYHVGALGYAGMKGAQLYPIIGFDYTLNKHWSVLAIFPIDYYIQYKFNANWILAVKVHPLKERFRAGENQPQPKSIFSYSSSGAELNLRYEIFRRLDVEAYGGWNFGGSFYIKDKNGHNALYTDIEGAPYGGASLNFGF